MTSFIIELVIIFLSYPLLKVLFDKILPGQEVPADENKMVRFCITLVCFIICLLIILLTLVLGIIGAFGDVLAIFSTGTLSSSHTLEIAGIVLSLVYAFVTFASPYLSRKRTLTRRFGIVTVTDIIWWLYIIFF